MNSIKKLLAGVVIGASGLLGAGQANAACSGLCQATFDNLSLSGPLTINLGDSIPFSIDMTLDWDGSFHTVSGGQIGFSWNANTYLFNVVPQTTPSTLTPTALALTSYNFTPTNTGTASFFLSSVSINYGYGPDTSEGTTWTFDTLHYGDPVVTDNTAFYSVTVNAVPEPEQYAMLLAGLGLLGFMARRRKQKETA